MHERKLLHGLEGYFYLLTDLFYMFPFLSLSALPFFLGTNLPILAEFRICYSSSPSFYLSIFLFFGWIVTQSATQSSGLSDNKDSVFSINLVYYVVSKRSYAFQIYLNSLSSVTQSPQSWVNTIPNNSARSVAGVSCQRCSAVDYVFYL